MQNEITIFKNLYASEPYYISIDKAFERIKTGKSKALVEEIRSEIDKERANTLKANLPSVCFSGMFEQRNDAGLKKHSGYVILDFDNIEKVHEKKIEIAKHDFIKAVWISPSGNGLKALAKIKNPKKHKEHYEALQEIFPQNDVKNSNISRVCFESYDPEIIIKENVSEFDELKKKQEAKGLLNTDNDVFDKILKWLTNKGDAFVKGERNLFLYKLASACCRFGINQYDCENLISYSILSNDNDFKKQEAIRTIKSAYKTNASNFATAKFENENLIEKKTRKEVVIDTDIYDIEIKPKDVIFGEDVKREAIDIYLKGYEGAYSTYIPEVDNHFKFKRGEISLLSGIGNYGKSTFLKYLLLIQVIKMGRKFAIFSPEDNPAEEFYHDMVEMILGVKCTPENQLRPTKDMYELWYDFVSKHFFYVYPKNISPSPEYIKERFLELIIKQKIDGCIIDPFNQLYNDYASFGNRSDKYLEYILSDFSRFAQTNSTIFMVVAHPKAMRKEKDSLNYPEPDVFDIADGAMWNNKMDNIGIYHRPFRGENPNDTTCTFSMKKVRRQKIVGVPGTITFNLSTKTRRYVFNGVDYLEMYVNELKTLMTQKGLIDFSSELKEDVAPF